MEIYFKCYSDGNALFERLEKYFKFCNKERYNQSLDYKKSSSVFYLENVA
jgi:hypothetical protein